MHYLNTIGSLVTKYVPDYLNEIVEQLVLLWELDTSTFVYGSGKRKSKEQRQRDINHTRAIDVLSLAREIGCKSEELLEI